MAERGDTNTTSKAVTVDLIIKLGGAAITDKSKLETLKADALMQGAKLVQRCFEAGKRVIVVHGAGSFGHHQAKHYKVNEGFDADPKHAGFCLTRNSVTTLNKHVVESLASLSLPAVSLPPFPAWKMTKKEVSSWPAGATEDVIENNFIPVFHGDCVLDTDQGCCILSGDTIIQILCQHFDVERVVFLADVHGVYDKPPDQEGASLIHSLIFPGVANIEDSITLSHSSHDVTGGMLTKLKSCASIASSHRTRAFVTKIGSADAEKVCLNIDIQIKDLQATEIVVK